MQTTMDFEPRLAPRAPANRGPVAVSVRGLKKRFQVRRRFIDTLRHPFRQEYTQALNGVDCDVYAGEFFGFLGANGAGKTTLFKILATLVRPDSGTVIVGGNDVMRHAAKVRSQLTPVIADERSLRWRLSARENLRLYAVLYGVPSCRVASRVDEVLGIVGLEPASAKLVGRFSSGMRQRLLIARALLAQPKVLLLDEPTRSLDPVSARNLRAFLRDEICRKLGCTILLATHTAEEAFELCDRVAILDRGQRLAVGETDKLQLEFGEDRYLFWTRTPDHSAIAALAVREVIRHVSLRSIDDEGWARVEIAVPGGPASAAEVLRHLVQHDVTVARFERIELSLGELIQRVIRRGTGVKNA